MTRFSKRYANDCQKDKFWRKVNKMNVGHNEFMLRPSSHALARLKKKNKTK